MLVLTQPKVVLKSYPFLLLAPYSMLLSPYVITMYLKLKVTPDSKTDSMVKIKDDEYRVTVRVPAENNAANTRVLEMVRELYPNQSVRIVSGHHSPSKIVSIG